MVYVWNVGYDYGVKLCIPREMTEFKNACEKLSALRARSNATSCCDGNGADAAQYVKVSLHIFLRTYYSVPCCEFIILRAYPVCLYFHLPCCALIFFALTLLCPYFIRTYPAVLTLLRLPCSALILFSLTLLCP